jgi:site-specific DNA-methyltransferase (adenine-specific)
MRTYRYNNNNYIKLYNADCLEIMQRLVNKGMQVDAIITDPPYGLLDHKLDKWFDNQKFFKLAYEIIKKDGFLVFFGRGVENAKRMVIADEVGFKFKEEIVWNKKNFSTFTLNLHRIHEMVYIFTKGNGTINKVYKPATDEIFIYDKDEYIKVLEHDITRLIGKINNIKNFNEFEKWRNGGIKTNHESKFKVTVNDLNYTNDRSYGIFNKYNKGSVVKSIVSIYNTVRSTRSQIHPTEKPVKLLQILIELIDNQQDNFTILDPFAGSCSQAIACYNLNNNFIGCEIDNEYYNAAVNRIYKECLPKLF